MTDLQRNQNQGRGRPSKDTTKPAEEQRADSESQARKTGRVSMARTRKLDFKPKQGYVAYWFKDIPGRVQQAQQAGYEFVTDAEGAKITQPSGANTMYLMQIPEEFRKEDFELGQQKVADITRSKVMQLGQDEYVPDGQSAPLQRDKDLPV